METPAMEAIEEREVLGLWLEPWKQNPRIIEFADLQFPGERAELVIGKTRDCDVFVVTDSLVSGEHWRIFARDGELWVEDSGSRNGTTVNRIPLEEEMRLREGYVIKFGRSFATAVGAESDLLIEGATYTSWMCNAARKHGSLRAAGERIHRSKSAIHSAVKRRAAGKKEKP